jgi:outer membrane protein OmpA-like peptidoglycan-associated protein
MLGGLAILGEHERIEADLTARTMVALERAGYGWANVHFEGRDAVLSGNASDDSEPTNAIAMALDTLGVRTVDNRVTLGDKPETYEWGALRRDNRIRVNGYVPSEKTRRDVIGIVKANFPSFDVDDRMKLARGSPPVDVWMGGVGFGLKQLALLREGRIELDNAGISVSGTALDVRSYRAVTSALSGQLPQGIRLKKQAVQPPAASPYTWSARRQASELLLVGHVPGDEVRDELMRAGRKLLPEAKVVDRMEPASGAPPQFVEAAIAVLQQLALLEEGTAQVRDRKVSLAGIAETAGRADQVKGAIRQGALAAFEATGDIRHRELAVQTISPFETIVAIEGDRVILRGHVPDEAARAALTAMARQRFGGVQLLDELQLGAGQPVGWERCLEVAFGALHRLGNGRAALSDRHLAIAGTTDTEALQQSLPASVRKEVGGACDADVRVTLDLAAIRARDEAQARDEARRKQDEDAARSAEQDRRQKSEMARLDLERQRAEAAQKAQIEEERRRMADEERRRAEAAARQQAEEERRRAEAAARQQAEEERRRAEAAARQQAEEERRRAEAAARQQAEEERRRAEAAARQQAEEERRRAEAAARQQADEERRRAEAAARQQQADEERRRAEAAARQQADEERRRAEAAARQQQADEARRRAEAAAQQQADEERRRAEAAARQQQADEERRRAEAAAHRKAEAERIARLSPKEQRKEIDVCQDALTRIVREGVINFNRASYDLDPASYPTLNKLADAANRCPALVVEIEGHTDAEGTVERNKRLSNRRANTVREYLSRAGVEPSRLEAIGFGQSRPIAPNDTAEGRAMNRRIEFTVRLKE